MQVEPTKPKLKATRIKRLKLKHDEPLVSSGFKLNLRHYTEAFELNTIITVEPGVCSLIPSSEHLTVGRCKVSLSNPR